MLYCTVWHTRCMNMNENDLAALDGLLDAHLQQLMQQTLFLLEREARQPKAKAVVDYGFIIFTGAIVYEGFLKRFFYTLGLISVSQLRSEAFRIGKALNPDLPERYRGNDYVYDQIEHYCGDAVATQLWQAWKQGRNQVFHYDFMGKKNITFAEAEARIGMFFEAMMAAVYCEKTIKRDE
jgi:hypothetical protein